MSTNSAGSAPFWPRQYSPAIHLPRLTSVAVPVKEFLTLTTCPQAWIHHDLYVFRDDQIAFYVGQSDCAFARVWTHLHDGFKGRSLVGKFVRNNWPRSMRFTIELVRADSDLFQPILCNRNDAERILITALRPCFNSTYNREPTALPTCYMPPNETVAYPRNMGKMMREAEHALRRQPRPLSW